jgi:hypothetical protein
MQKVLSFIDNNRSIYFHQPTSNSSNKQSQWCVATTRVFRPRRPGCSTHSRRRCAQTCGSTALGRAGRLSQIMVVEKVGTVGG